MFRSLGNRTQWVDATVCSQDVVVMCLPRSSAQGPPWWVLIILWSRSTGYMRFSRLGRRLISNIQNATEPLSLPCPRSKNICRGTSALTSWTLLERVQDTRAIDLWVSECTMYHSVGSVLNLVDIFCWALNYVRAVQSNVICRKVFSQSRDGVGS